MVLYLISVHKSEVIGLLKTRFKNLFVRQIAIKSPGRPKLSQNITVEIKGLARAHPKWSLQTLARAAGVSKTSVYNVLNKRWGLLPTCSKRRLKRKYGRLRSPDGPEWAFANALRGRGRGFPWTTQAKRARTSLRRAGGAGVKCGEATPFMIVTE